jgi:hypothetical protein
MKKIILFISLLIIIISSLVFIFNSGFSTNLNAQSSLEITFKEDFSKFKMPEKKLIDRIIVKSEKEIRSLLPNLPKDITVTISISDANFDHIGGVNGQTDRNSPAKVTLEVSNSFPGGIEAAINSGLKIIVFHEFHHLSRGWAIEDNKFGPGISIAMVNEGMAVAFQEIRTGINLEHYQYPNDVNSWVEEILALPIDASWGVWMSKHSDGRHQIGYRAGSYLVRQAMEKSGENILELSKLTPDEVIQMAGY